MTNLHLVVWKESYSDNGYSWEEMPVFVQICTYLHHVCICIACVFVEFVYLCWPVRGGAKSVWMWFPVLGRTPYHKSVLCNDP